MKLLTYLELFYQFMEQIMLIDEILFIIWLQVG
jgi:hypothetical protein